MQKSAIPVDLAALFVALELSEAKPQITSL